MSKFLIKSSCDNTSWSVLTESKLTLLSLGILFLLFLFIITSCFDRFPEMNPVNDFLSTKFKLSHNSMLQTFIVFPFFLSTNNELPLSCALLLFGNMTRRERIRIGEEKSVLGRIFL